MLKTSPPTAALLTLVAIFAGTAALAAPQIAFAQDAQEESKPPRNSSGEAELSKMLEGRTMGEPQRCLRDSERRNMEIIDRTAFVFRDGDTIYVNRPNGARFLDSFDLPVFRLFGSGLCRLDQVELRDRGSLMSGPLIAMSDFVPYKLKKETDQ